MINLGINMVRIRVNELADYRDSVMVDELKARRETRMERGAEPKASAFLT